jgi:hypothetical protein
MKAGNWSRIKYFTGANAVAFKQVGLTYNDANQVTGLNRFSQQVANPNDPTTVFSDSLAYSVYSYDIAGRMTGLVNTAAQTGSSTQH